jgi:hypothetical protein
MPAMNELIGREGDHTPKKRERVAAALRPELLKGVDLVTSLPPWLRRCSRHAG